MQEKVTSAAKSATAAEVTSEVKKVNRRGVSSARGTTRLKFSHEQAKQNGLFLAHLDSVTVSTIKIGEDTTGMPSFNGMDIPRISFVFASNEAEANKRHYITLSFNAVESNVNTIPGGKEEWKVNSVFDWFKHIVDVFVLKGKEMDDEMANALSLSFEDFDENGEYVPVESEDVIAGWKVLFENMENILNRGRDGEPVYKTKDNKDITLWIKLLRYVKSNRKGWQAVNNGDLSFPTFVGEGCIEIFKQNTLPSIRIDSIKESIIPMKIEKAKNPNMPTNMMGGGSAPIMGGVPVEAPMSGVIGADVIAMEAQDDMPF